MATFIAGLFRYEIISSAVRPLHRRFRSCVILLLPFDTCHAKHGRMACHVTRFESQYHFDSSKNMYTSRNSCSLVVAQMFPNSHRKPVPPRVLFKINYELSSATPRLNEGKRAKSWFQPAYLETYSARGMITDRPPRNESKKRCLPALHGLLARYLVVKGWLNYFDESSIRGSTGSFAFNNRPSWGG